MTRPQIVSILSRKADIPKKTASVVLDALVDAIHETLTQENGKIRISSLGTFRVIEMEPRRGVNPRTGKAMIIPAMRLPRFSPSKKLRETIKKGNGKRDLDRCSAE